MSINSISSFGSFNLIPQNQLSEETKRKLLALGIDPATVTNEAQAETLILTLQVQKTNNESSSKNTCSSETELFSRAKILASKIGVHLSQADTMESIIDKLDNQIKKLDTKNFTNNNSSEEVNSYKNEILSIKDEYQAIKQNKNSLQNAMAMTASINKFLLGLK